MATTTNSSDGKANEPVIDGGATDPETNSKDWESIPKDKMPPAHAYRWYAPSMKATIAFLVGYTIYMVLVYAMWLSGSNLFLAVGLFYMCIPQIFPCGWMYALSARHAKPAFAATLVSVSQAGFIFIFQLMFNYNLAGFGSLTGAIFAVGIATIHAKDKLFGIGFYTQAVFLQMSFGLLLVNANTIMQAVPEGLHGLVPPLIKIIYMDIGAFIMDRIWICTYKPPRNCTIMMLVAIVMVVSVESFCAVRFIGIGLGDWQQCLIFAVTTIITETDNRLAIKKGVLFKVLGQDKRNQFKHLRQCIRRAKLAVSYCWVPALVSVTLGCLLAGRKNPLLEGGTWLLAFIYVVIQAICDIIHIFSQRKPEDNGIQQTYHRILGPEGTKHFLQPAHVSVSAKPLSEKEQISKGVRELTDEETQVFDDLDFGCLKLPREFWLMIIAITMPTSIVIQTLVTVWDPCDLVIPVGVDMCANP